MFEGYYLGLMSGTSMDAMDAVVVEIDGRQCNTVGFASHSIPLALKDEILSLTLEGNNELTRFARLSKAMAELAVATSFDAVERTGLANEAIIAIGSHGQTVRHLPHPPYQMSFQAADPHRIAELSGLLTVADFRQRDIVCGGEGAPLLPMFHDAFLLTARNDNAVINLGGIGNVSLNNNTQQGDTETKSTTLIGFDSGPANGLMDYWATRHLGQPYDESGRWAKSGTCNNRLLAIMLDDPYFSKTAPKSTGKEYFNGQWLESKLTKYTSAVTPEDVQSTLAELSAMTIAESLRPFKNLRLAIACGGGVRNDFLMARLAEHLRRLNEDFRLETSDQHGIDPQHVEASGFAWFAYRTLNSLPSSAASVTGARKDSVLGAIYPGSGGLLPLTRGG